MDLLEAGLGQGELHRNRVHLVDDHESAGICGVHDVARIHEACAGAAIDRGSNGGVVQLHPRQTDLRRVALQGSLQLRHQCSLRIQGLLGDGVVLDQLLIPLQIDLGIGKQHLIFGFLRQRLGQLGFINPWIDACQQLACFDHLPFAVEHRIQLAVNAGAYRDRGERQDRAGARLRHGHGLLLYPGRAHLDGCHGARWRIGLRLAWMQQQCTHQCQHRQG